jgi:hypothetical protein
LNANRAPQLKAIYKALYLLLTGTFESMPRDINLRLKLAAGFGLGALILNLISILGHFHGDGIAGLWEFLNLIPFFLSLFIAGNPHSGSPAVIVILSVIQWAAVGYLVGKLLR